jgi:starch synthase
MNILFISTEAEPFAKSGGLGDVIGSLPGELNKLGADARVMLPLYKSVKEEYQAELKLLGDFTVALSWRNQYCGVFRMEQEGVVFYFIDNEQYFGRDAYYGYYDDGERFAYYSKAAVEALPLLDFKPDVLHCSEWQTAPVPVYLKTLFRGDRALARLRTVFTIHNIEYQGKFDRGILSDVLGLSEADRGLVDYDEAVNYMKGAVVACDRLTTVSRTYAEEITHPFYGKGLERIIKENRYKLQGIRNGIDTARYNPFRDPYIAAKYSKNNPENKTVNKKALQESLGLYTDAGSPIIAMVGRLAEHKGIGLVERVFDEIMAEDVQFVLLGTGEARYESFFRSKAEEYKGRVSATTVFSEELASRIYAGADLFLMPSVSEPCGLAQMIALRYGTVPIVRETGGLKDTVAPYDPETGTGNGVTFATVNAHDMLGAVRRALRLYRDKDQWKALVRNGMTADFSWKASSKEYMRLYKELLI